MLIDIYKDRLLSWVKLLHIIDLKLRGSNSVATILMLLDCLLDSMRLTNSFGLKLLLWLKRLQTWHLINTLGKRPTILLIVFISRKFDSFGLLRAA